MSIGLTGTALGAGFREFLLTIYPDPSERHDQSRWADSLTRWLRYRYLWAFYDQSIYWGYYSELLKREFGLYKNIRPVFNSLSRLVECHVAHLMGGRLDRDAGNGKTAPSALPIIPGKKADKSLPGGIARLWADSAWQRKKSLFTRHGAALGDTALELCDDPAKGRIRMRVVHPGEIKSATVDPYGGVTRSVLERYERDPEDPTGDRIVRYREEATQDGDVVHYRTFREEQPYAWPGSEGSEWDSPFPFVPLVLAQHLDMGFPWGASETASAIGKTVERDDQGSNLSDGIRRMTNGPWMLKGAVLPTRPGANNPWAGDPFGPQTPPAENFFQLKSVQIAARADMPIIQCPSDSADMKPLIYPIPVADVVAFVEKIGETLERDFPELQIDLATSSGDASGRALRVARQKATQKYEERRGAYDAALARAQAMALVMGGTLGYEGYEAFKGAEVDGPAVEHWIGTRPVFGVDPLDTIEVQQAKATAVKTWVEAGVPVESALRQVDMEPDDIETIMDLRQEEAEKDFEQEQERLAAVVKAQAAQAEVTGGDAGGDAGGTAAGGGNNAPPRAGAGAAVTPGAVA